MRGLAGHRQLKNLDARRVGIKQDGTSRAAHRRHERIRRHGESGVDTTHGGPEHVEAASLCGINVVADGREVRCVHATGRHEQKKEPAHEDLVGTSVAELFGARTLSRCPSDLAYAIENLAGDGLHTIPWGRDLEIDRLCRRDGDRMSRALSAQVRKNSAHPGTRRFILPKRRAGGRRRLDHQDRLHLAGVADASGQRASRAAGWPFPVFRHMEQNHVGP